MTYDEAKAQVFKMLWLPEVGQHCLLHLKRGRIVIIVYATREAEPTQVQRIAAYQQHHVDRRYYFTLSEWWACTSKGHITPSGGDKFTGQVLMAWPR